MKIGESKFNENPLNRTIIFPSEEWGEFSPVTLPEKFQYEPNTPYHSIVIPMSFITKQFDACGIGFNLEMGFYLNKPVKFLNSGEAPGAGCASLETYNADEIKIGEDLSCWTVSPGEVRKVSYVVDISFSDLFKGYSCREV